MDRTGDPVKAVVSLWNGETQLLLKARSSAVEPTSFLDILRKCG